MTTLMPYINFDGKAAEAMTFYKEILGANLYIQKVGETPMKDEMAFDMHDKVLHAMLTSPGLMMGASDMLGSKNSQAESNVNIILNFDSEKEMNNIWDKFLEGSTVRQALKKTFWGMFGDLTDKYGINWMFNYISPQK